MRDHGTFRFRPTEAWKNRLALRPSHGRRSLLFHSKVPRSLGLGGKFFDPDPRTSLPSLYPRAPTRHRNSRPNRKPGGFRNPFSERSCEKALPGLVSRSMRRRLARNGFVALATWAAWLAPSNSPAFIFLAGSDYAKGE